MLVVKRQYPSLRCLPIHAAESTTHQKGSPREVTVLVGDGLTSSWSANGRGRETLGLVPPAMAIQTISRQRLSFEQGFPTRHISSSSSLCERDCSATRYRGILKVYCFRQQVWCPARDYEQHATLPDTPGRWPAPSLLTCHEVRGPQGLVDETNLLRAIVVAWWRESLMKKGPEIDSDEQEERITQG